RYIIWGCNFMSIPFHSCGRIIWDKLNWDSYQRDAEIAYVSFMNDVRIIYYLWKGMFQGLTPSLDATKAMIQQGNKSLNEKRIHPTQKPVKLYEWLLMNYAKEGDKILDTHLGSGSSRIAAHKLGFEFVGCELDKDYFEAQEKRFKTETMQQILF
ncbi:MAG: DNA methyltransferase, partial [Bacteroides sp.]